MEDKTEQADLSKYYDLLEELMDSGFYNSLFELSFNTDYKQLELICQVLQTVFKDIKYVVIYIQIFDKDVKVLLDPVFDFESIPQLKNSSVWAPYMDCRNLYKGFITNYKDIFNIHILKNVIWTKEGKA